MILKPKDSLFVISKYVKPKKVGWQQQKNKHDFDKL